MEGAVVGSIRLCPDLSKKLASDRYCGGSNGHECMLPTNRLDLGHSRPTSSNTAQSCCSTTTPCRQSREHQASEEGGEAEPEERGHSLRFLTSLFIIIGASSDLVG